MYDVGFLHLSATAPSDAAIYPILTSLSGITTSTRLDIVGYGFGGNPAQGLDPAGTRRHARNTFDTFSNGASCAAPVSSVPDNPIKMCAVFQPFVVPSNTGLIMDGDSGGPAFFFNTGSGMYEILGVASFSNLHDAFAGPGSFYSGHANLADPGNAVFVESVLAADAAAPEPGSALTIGAGLFLLAGLLRLRSPAGVSQ